MADILWDIVKIGLTAGATTALTLTGVRQAQKVAQADAVIDHLDDCALTALKVIRKISAGEAPDDDAVDDWQDAFAKLSRDAQRRFSHTTAMGLARTSLSDLEMSLQAADPTSRDVVLPGGGPAARASIQQSQASCRRALIACAKEVLGYGIWGRHGR